MRRPETQHVSESATQANPNPPSNLLPLAMIALLAATAVGLLIALIMR
jgi:hypothetical protein